MVKAKKKTKKKRRKPDVVCKPSRPPRNAQGQLIAGWGKGSKKLSKADKKKKKIAAKVKRGKDGKLLPGTGSLNPAGPGKSVIYRSNLLAAIREVEAAKGKLWLKTLIEKSYEDTTLAIALLGRLFPQMKAIEMSGTAADSMEDAEAEEIRKEFKKRFTE